MVENSYINKKLRTLTFNIQKLKQLGKLNTFFLQIKLEAYHIIILTEFCCSMII